MINFLNQSPYCDQGEALRILGIDQSVSKCAYCVLEDDNVLYKGLSKTGGLDCKGKKFKSVQYFKTDAERIHYICDFACNLINEYNIDHIALEGLAFGASGNATRTLSMLYGALLERFICEGFDESKILILTPTSVKHFARSWFTESQQYTLEGKKKTLLKMDKKKMIEAVILKLGEDYLSGYKASGEHAGADDISDATVIAFFAKEKIIGLQEKD